jgi:chorismate mutase/prephenate dehydratase
VVYLGPEGTFSHFAAMAALGRAGEFEPKPSIDDVFAAVAAREADLGLVPLENSLQGTVGQSLDLFMRHDVFVQAEVYCKISHALLSKATDLAHVKTVYSHPQPLAQCAGWLRAHLPKARIIPTESTAAAALRILKTPSAAAIGHRRLGEMHNLNVLAARIEDLPDNWTRFLIIGPADTKQENRDKTAILFNLPDKPGALHSVLAKLAGRDINMTKLESRPFRGENGKYVFFAACRCEFSRAEYAKLLDELRACTHASIQGCYPAARIFDVSGGTEVIEDRARPDLGRVLRPFPNPSPAGGNVSPRTPPTGADESFLKEGPHGGNFFQKVPPWPPEAIMNRAAPVVVTAPPSKSCPTRGAHPGARWRRRVPGPACSKAKTGAHPACLAPWAQRLRGHRRRIRGRGPWPGRPQRRGRGPVCWT